MGSLVYQAIPLQKSAKSRAFAPCREWVDKNGINLEEIVERPETLRSKQDRLW